MVALFLFLKGMTGALAPLSYQVFTIKTFVLMNKNVFFKGLNYKQSLK